MSLLTRETLASDDFITSAQALNLPYEVMTDKDLKRSINETLAQSPADARPNGGLWVFCYGSLIWNPLFAFQDKRKAVLQDYRRGFFLKTIYGRGSVDKPGLVLALDERQGARVEGQGLFLSGENIAYELFLLWRREMLFGSYVPRWVQTSCNGVTQSMLTFVIDKQGGRYAGDLSICDRIAMIRSGQGVLGSALDYFLQTKDCFEQHSIYCEEIDLIANALRNS